jgi:hypothetical protein
VANSTIFFRPVAAERKKEARGGTDVEGNTYDLSTWFQLLRVGFHIPPKDRPV